MNSREFVDKDMREFVSGLSLNWSRIITDVDVLNLYMYIYIYMMIIALIITLGEII